MSGFFEVTSKPLPKWFRALTISGKPAGLGFQCPKCHLGYPHSAPEQIFHCGALEAAPKMRIFLPQRRIGGEPSLPPNIIPIGTW